MAYSVLTLDSNNCCLYCSEKQSCILTGTREEMFEWKHKMEDGEQQIDNAEYMQQVKKERLALLISAGNTEEKATTFLKKAMPYLFL